MLKSKKFIMLALFPIMVLCLTAAFTLGFNTQKVSATGEDFYVASAEMRLDEHPGIRFTAAMTDEYYQDAINFEGKAYFGVLILKTEWAATLTEGNYIPSLQAKIDAYNAAHPGAETDLTVDQLITNSTPFQNTDAEGELIDPLDDNWYIQGSISDILYDNYNLDYTVIGFVKQVRLVEGNYVSTYAYTGAYTPRNVTEVASKSLNVAGYENNTDIQAFLVKGIYSQNGETETDASSAEYADLNAYLGLSVSVVSGVTDSHADSGATLTYSVTSSTGKTFANLALLTYFGSEQVATANNTFSAVDGYANLAFKNGGVTYGETASAFYVGKKAFSLYSDLYSNNAPNATLVKVNSGKSFLGWGYGASINSYGVAPNFLDMPAEIASAYETEYGEEAPKAYTFKAPENKLAFSSETLSRYGNLRIILTDAEYVFNNYNKVTVRFYYDNDVNPSGVLTYTAESHNYGEGIGTAIYVDKGGNRDNKASGIKKNSTYKLLPNSDLGKWIDVEYRLSALLDTYDGSSDYSVTFGFDLPLICENINLYIASIEFDYDQALNEYISIFAGGSGSDATISCNWTHTSLVWGMAYAGTSGINNQWQAGQTIPSALKTSYAAKEGWGTAPDTALTVVPQLNNFSYGNYAYRSVLGTNATYGKTATDYYVAPDSTGDSDLYAHLKSKTTIKFRVYIQAAKGDGTPITANVKSAIGTFGFVPSIRSQNYATTQGKTLSPAMGNNLGVAQTYFQSVPTNQWVEVAFDLSCLEFTYTYTENDTLKTAYNTRFSFGFDFFSFVAACGDTANLASSNFDNIHASSAKIYVANCWFE